MNRIYHTWDKWECYPAGFYEIKPPRRDMTSDDCKTAYAEFLRDTPRFKAALHRILTEWPNSCEHYLSNEKMNRLAWLGQASMCIETGVSKFFCGGFFQLSKAEQDAANYTALEALNQWLSIHGDPELTIEGAASKTQADLY